MATKEGDVRVIREGLTFKRYFTRDGVHPFDEIEWETRDAVIPNYKEGGNAFEQRDVEFPVTWSQNATNIVAQKYFRGTLGTPQRESSVRQLVGRVVDTITGWGRKGRYFASDDDAKVFSDELSHLLVTQKAAFNSPVWFNVGVPDTPQQCSACFILAVDDTMSSILNWYVEEGTIFKGGSGSGINLSRIRSSREPLAGGGTASGPVSFMRGADASAGTIKSGGKTRRAAKMVILDVDHPDVSDFIWCKAREEQKARALRDAGFDMDLDGRDAYSIQYQNANNSVRVNDEFMKAYEQDQDWKLKAVITDETVETVRARELMREIAQAAWECADPGMQYDTTINEWHTCPATGRINASNPCSEYMHLDNSACNLASLNLMKFIDAEGTFDVKAFRRAVEVVFTAQEIIVGPADYPTEKIGENARAFRQLGLGYANLGALLMARGLPYDSDGGRAWAGAITALMTGQAYRTSARIAEAMGPFEGYEPNADAMLRVMRKHRAAADEIDGDAVPEAVLSAAKQSWDDAIAFGSQARVPELAGDGARAHRHDRPDDGLRHHGHRARARARQDQEARGRRHDAVREPDRAAGARPARVRPGAGRGHRRLHRRAQLGRGRAAPARGARGGVRHGDGRPADPLHGARADDGGGPAVHLGRDQQDGQHARARHGRRGRAAVHRVVEARPEGRRDLPGQLQGRAAAVGGQEEERRGTSGGRARHAGAQAPAAEPAVDHDEVRGRRRRGLHHGELVPRRRDRRDLPEVVEAGLDARGDHRRVLDRGLDRPAVRRAARGPTSPSSST